MPELINNFYGQYAFLSNFYPAPFSFKHNCWRKESLMWVKVPTVEHAYQMGKTENRLEAEWVLAASKPAEAKLRGQKVNLRPDFERIKRRFMKRLVERKFTQNPDLLHKLLVTGDASLLEGNNWHDNFWGSCRCGTCDNIVGENHLGKILMEVREEYRECQ